jgi:hypothetical protein
MKIKMKLDIHGMFHNMPAGVRRGDIVDIDDDNAARYCALGYAQPDLKGELGPAHLPAPLKPTF